MLLSAEFKYYKRNLYAFVHDKFNFPVAQDRDRMLVSS